MGSVLIVVLAFLVAGFIVGFTAGVSWNTKTVVTRELRLVGLTMDAAKLYGRAVRIFRRLSGLAVLDGELSGDALSPRSRELIVTWLDDYRRLTEKGDPGTVTGGKADGAL